MIHTGDCLTVMAGMDPESVDAIVTDPPYDLTDVGRSFQGKTSEPRPGEVYVRRVGGFMGKTWDGTGIAFRPETWAAALRVARPGAYLLAFGGTRTFHRLACAIEDAGWIIRDTLVWAYASGFPKSKASLKPAWEPILLARKPGPLRELAIDECRLPTTEDRARHNAERGAGVAWAGSPAIYVDPGGTGRWPANVILTDPIFDGGWDGVVGGGSSRPGSGVASPASGGWSGWAHEGSDDVPGGYGDQGTYSRFFLLPKASRSDREPLLPGTLPLSEAPWQAAQHLNGGTACTVCGASVPNATAVHCDAPTKRVTARGTDRVNTHATVKPTELMRHLVRLVTPQGGTVLDPFLGSGSTAIAAEQEGFAWIGIEREAEYVAIAEARLALVQRGLGLPA